MILNYNIQGGEIQESEVSNMKSLNREDVRHYCVSNGLCTAGSVDQYEKMLAMVDLGRPIANIATVIWICSDTDKHADEIENDLRELTERM